MFQCEIRKVGLDEVDALRNISIQTFKETFASMNSASDMRKYLSEQLSTVRLKHELSNPESEFYFAQVNQETLGYLKLNFGAAQTEQLGIHSLEIERIYVVDACKGKGLGQALLHYSIKRAKDTQAAQIWLGVWEENHAAIRFYLKNDFVPFDSHTFHLGDDEQRDVLMKRSL